MKNKNLSCLIVEDEVFSIIYLKGILESLGFSVIYESTNMKDALKIAKDNHIDIVFMDININGSADGIECAKKINELYFLPVIFTTAYTDSDTIEEASDANIYGYLTKPFEPHEVESSLLIALKQINKNSYKEKEYKDTDTVDLSSGQKYNMTNNTFSVDNKTINLTTKELAILNVLSKNLNNNVTYDMLKEYAWSNKDISNSTIRDAVSRLKRKAPDLKIENIVSLGYVLKK